MGIDQSQLMDIAEHIADLAYGSETSVEEILKEIAPFATQYLAMTIEDANLGGC